MTLVTLAGRLAFSRDVRQRWRQVGIITSSGVAAVLILTGIGIAHVATVAQHRVIARSPVEAVAADRAVLQSSTRALVIGGRDDLGQFPVIWLEPRPGHELDEAAIPPGLSAMPGPGEGVLSPGLVNRGFTAEDFGLNSSRVGRGPRGAIGAEGLATASEGWIYARPAVGRSLGQGGLLTPLAGYEPSDAPSAKRLNQETVLEIPAPASAWAGLLWLVVAPVLYLVLGAARSLSALRLERSATLFRLGIARWRIRVLLPLESVLLAGPGLAAGATLWFVLGDGMTSVPMTGVTLLPRALEIPGPQSVTALLTLTALIGLAGMVGPLEAEAGRIRRRTPHAVQLVPLVGSVGMMAASRLAPPMSRPAAYLLFGGVILCVASLPLALPVLRRPRDERSLDAGRPPSGWLGGGWPSMP